MAELENLKCSQCGAEWSKHNHIEVTGCGKVLCQACERACKNYRQYMLPNGTHCMSAFEEEYFKYRLIAMNIPAPPSAVKKARKNYENVLSGDLFEILAAKTRIYRTYTEPKAQAKARVELEAIRQILYDRIQKSDINRHLFEIMNNLKELKKCEAG